MARPIKHRGRWRIRWPDATGKRQSEVYDDYKAAQVALSRHQAHVDEVQRGLRAPDPPDKTFEDLCDLWEDTLRPIEWREAFVRTARSFLFEAQRRDVVPGGRARIATGNVVDLAGLDTDFDVVLTSPPYCTRIDYAMTTGFELAALGLAGADEFRSLRERLMGTPVLRRADGPADSPRFAPSVERVLDRVSAHPSYASSGYYHRNLSQYFVDAQAAVQQIASKMRTGGVCLIVVQNSYYKEIEIDLPALYAEMGTTAGFREASIPFYVSVRSFFAGINGRAARHLAERSYREAVVVLRR